MKLVLLGSGGYYPNGRRHTACLLLPETGVMLDAGSGACRTGEYRQTDRLDIFLTHAHLDHVAGLTYLMSTVPEDVLRRTVVRGESAKLAAVREHLFAELIFPVPPRIQFEVLSEHCQLPGGGRLTHFPLTHPGGSIGFRLDWPGHTMAYVTDTTAAVDAAYVSQIRGVDLLVHEAYFADDTGNLPAITGHSSVQAVVEVAAAAKVGRLLLVHMDPQIDKDDAFDLTAARRVFPNTQIGVDRAEYEF